MKKIDEVLNKARELWGDEAQHQIAIGEIGELLSMYGRRCQNRDSKEEWIDEIADVLICVRQLALMVGIDAVEERMETKIKILDVKVKTHKTWQKAERIMKSRIMNGKTNVTP